MTMLTRSTISAALALFAVSALQFTPALAAGEHKDEHADTPAAHDDEHEDEHAESAGHGHGGPTGSPGAAADVTRTVKITMGDNFFEPENLTFAPGETIRFVVTNGGEFVHEFNIGTADMHTEHQKEMMMMVEQNVLLPERIDMKAAAKMQETMGHGMHKDPNSVLLEPGQSAEIIWTFPDEDEDDVVIEFGCNVPGHYEAGMVGTFIFGA